MARISFKRCETLATLMGYELVKHQQLGNAKGYWYNYSLVINNQRVYGLSSLKDCYEWLHKLASEQK